MLYENSRVSSVEPAFHGLKTEDQMRVVIPAGDLDEARRALSSIGDGIGELGWQPAELEELVSAGRVSSREQLQAWFANLRFNIGGGLHGAHGGDAYLKSAKARMVSHLRSRGVWPVISPDALPRDATSLVLAVADPERLDGTVFKRFGNTLEQGGFDGHPALYRLNIAPGDLETVSAAIKSGGQPGFGAMESSRVPTSKWVGVIGFEPGAWAVPVPPSSDAEYRPGGCVA